MNKGGTAQQTYSASQWPSGYAEAVTDSQPSHAADVQAKRWQNPVGRPEIQKFFGALTGKRASKGVFITTSSFTNEAAAYADGVTPRIILVDGKELARLMLDYEVGVTTERKYEIKRIDLDYFAVDDEATPGPPGHSSDG
jgi:restriction system protein